MIYILLLLAALKLDGIIDWSWTIIIFAGFIVNVYARTRKSDGNTGFGRRRGDFYGHASDSDGMHP